MYGKKDANVENSIHLTRILLLLNVAANMQIYFNKSK